MRLLLVLAFVHTACDPVGRPVGDVDFPDPVGPNAPPVADAGPDQVASRNLVVNLDASGSVDPDGDALTFAWALTGGTQPVTLSDASSPRPSFVAPATPDVLTFTLTVRDGIRATTDDVVVTVVDTPPQAHAGADRTIARRSRVTLDGSGTDADADPLTFAWTQTAGPPVTLTSTAIARPTFTSPAGPVPLVFQLVVHDGLEASPADEVTLTPVNTAPQAVAGSDVVVPKGTAVSLDARASTDADADPLTYRWSEMGTPSALAIDDASAAAPSVGAPCTSGVHTVRLTVSDGASQDTDDVKVTVTNAFPVVEAGADHAIRRNAVVTLQGAATDPDACDALALEWTQIAGPSVSMSDLTVATPTFVAPSADATLSFVLGAFDGEATIRDTVTLHVVNGRPVADAGPDLARARGAQVTLDGSVSTDPDGEPLSYSWSFVSGAAEVAVPSPLAVAPTVTLPSSVGGTFVFELVVSDGELSSTPARVRVVTPSAPPTADAGPDLEVNGGELVLLDGTASADPERQPLGYRWEQTAGPSVDVGSGTEGRTWVRAPEGVDATLRFSLEVSDGESTAVDAVTVQVRAWSGAPAPIEANPWTTRLDLYDVAQYAVAAAGDRLVVSGVDTARDSVQVLDVSEPRTPVVLGTVHVPGASPLAFDGTWLYVGVGGGLRVYEWVEATATLVSRGTTAGASGVDRLTELAVADGFVYALALQGTARGVTVFDVAQPAAPVVVSHTPIPSLTRLAARTGELWLGIGAEVVGYDTGSLGSPTPALVRITAPSEVPCTPGVSTLAVQGDWLFMGCGPQLVTVDLAAPADPLRVASLSIGGNAQSLGVAGDTAFVSVPTVGLQQVDVSDPTAPTLQSTQPLRAGAVQVAPTADAVFLLAGTSTEVVIPGVARPEFFASFTAVESVGDLAWDAGLLALGLGSRTQLVDVADPRAPALQATVPRRGAAGLVLSWPWLFLAGESQGLAVVDVADPSAASIVATWGGGAGALPTDCFLADDRLYTTTAQHGLRVLDVSDPRTPTEVGAYPADRALDGPVVEDGLLWVAESLRGISALDVSDPTRPRSLATLSNPQPSGPVAKSGRYLYNGKLGQGFLRWDVGDPAVSTPARAFDRTAKTPADIVVRGAVAFMAEGPNGLAIADVSDPDHVQLLGRHAVTTSAVALALDPDFVWVADGASARAVSIDNARWDDRHVSAAASTALTYGLSWEQPVTGGQARCIVTGGSCEVTSVDPGARSAQVRWQLPDGGDHEIAVIVGHAASHAVLRDRISVTAP